MADGALRGRGEGTAIYYRGETAEGVVAHIDAQADAVAAGVTRADLLDLMLARQIPAGLVTMEDAEREIAAVERISRDKGAA